MQPRRSKGNVDTTKAPKSGGASGKTASASKKRNAADQGGNIAKKKGRPTLPASRKEQIAATDGYVSKRSKREKE